MRWGRTSWASGATREMGTFLISTQKGPDLKQVQPLLHVSTSLLAECRDGK